jgi:hypothetical protein
MLLENQQLQCVLSPRQRRNKLNVRNTSNVRRLPAPAMLVERTSAFV